MSSFGRTRGDVPATLRYPDELYPDPEAVGNAVPAHAADQSLDDDEQIPALVV